MSQSTSGNVILNIDGLVTDINGIRGQVAALESRRYIVEESHDGTEWYRVWSDGWTEQGGITSTFGATDITVSLSKSFSNTNYTVTLATLYSSNGMTNDGGYVKSKATTEFIIHSEATAVKAAMWYACGY